jgi:hypothetical protein
MAIAPCSVPYTGEFLVMSVIAVDQISESGGSFFTGDQPG